MPWYLINPNNYKPVAYVNGVDAVIDPFVASEIEPCLMAYGIGLLMIEKEVERGGMRIEGYQVKIVGPSVDEGKIIRAIEVCVAISFGIRLEKEEIEKIYEVVGTKEKEDEEKINKEVDEDVVEFEKA